MRPTWYIDGVSCIGKTTFVASLGAEGLLLDYAERRARHSFFQHKDRDHALQVLYTASFCAKVADAASHAQRPLLVDRSPISDVWYELVFKHYDDRVRYDQLFQYIEHLGLFSAYPTIFLLPDECHAEAIQQQILVRNNGIDSTGADYVLRQIRVFDAVCNHFETHPSVRVVRIPPNPPIFSARYFAYLHTSIHQALQK